MKNGFLYSLLTIIIVVFVYSNSHVMYPVKLHHVRTGPEFHVDEFFSGNIVGWGVVYNAWNSKAVDYFHLSVAAKWNGPHGNLAYGLRYSDGKEESMNWTLALNDDHTLGIDSNQIIRPAKIHQYGSNASFVYSMYKNVNEKVHEITCVVNLTMVDSRTVVMDMNIKKYGIVVYKAFVTMQKQPEDL